LIFIIKFFISEVIVVYFLALYLLRFICDIYPVKTYKESKNSLIPCKDIEQVALATNSYRNIGRNKVLQAFSWKDLGGGNANDDYVFPSFDESRYIAYSAIANGTKGIFYWGAQFSKGNEEFIKSIYAVVQELSYLEPFLISPQKDVKIKAIKDCVNQSCDVSCFAGRFGHDSTFAVVNETDENQMEVVVENLKYLNGEKFFELYGDGEETVNHEEIVIRMKPREVKIFSTSKRWENTETTGRDYQGK